MKSLTAPFSTRRRSLVAVLVAACALALLSACAPAANGASATLHTVRPHHGGSGSTPTPTPTVASVTPPKVRIPLSCGQLVPAAQLNSTLGATLSTTAPSLLTTSTGVDPELNTYIATQAGALECSWTSPVPSGGNADATYDVMVMPDATTAWNTYAATIHQYYSVANPLGANSWSSCWVQGLASAGKDENCGFDILIGSTWLSVAAYTDEYSTIPTEAQAFTRFEPLFQSTIAAVKGTTVVEPAWTDPLATPVTFPSDGSAASPTGLATATGTAFSYNAAGFGPVNATTMNTSLSALLSTVNYHGELGGVVTGTAGSLMMSVQVLPSGAWAYGAMKTAAASSAQFATLSGIGTAAFMYNDAVGNPNEIVVVGTVGQNLYTISDGDSGAAGEPNPATVAKAAAGYLATQLGN